MLKKVILWGLVVFVVVAILGAAAVAIFLPKEKIKEMALGKISSMLHREVTIDDISISYFGGLGVKLNGVKISNPDNFDWSQFLEAKGLDIKLQLWPLLSKNIQVDRLILIEPRIALLKTRKGQINYVFGLIDSLAASDRTNLSVDIPEESKLALAAISFDNFSIENGYIEYVDDSSQTSLTAYQFNLKTKLDSPENMVYQISGNLNADSIVIKNSGENGTSIPTLIIASSFNSSIDLNKKQAVLSDSEIEINGWKFDIKAGIPNTETLDYFNLEIESGNKSLTEIISLFPLEYNYIPDGYSASGQMNFKAIAKYNAKSKEKMKYNGTANIDAFKLSIDSLEGDFGAKNLSIEYTNDAMGLSINNGSLDGNSIEGTINISDFDNIYVNSNVNGTADLTTLNRFLPEIGKPEMSGQASFDLSGKGRIEELTQFEVNGRLQITNGVYTAETLPEPIESFELDVAITPKSITVNNLAVKSPSSQFSMNGTMSDLFPYFIPGFEGVAQKPTMNFTLNSLRFDVDKLFPEAVPGSGSNLAEMPIGSLPPLPIPDIDGNGTASIDTLIYSDVEFSDIKCDINIKNRRIFVTNANGYAYTGKVGGKMSIDLNDFENPGYDGEFTAEQIEADDFLSRFTKFGGHLFGKVNMTGSFSATGWDPEPIINSLDMSGDANFNEARIVKFDMLNQLAEQLKFKSLSEETIRNLNSSYTVKDGRIAFEKFNFVSSLGDWTINGSVGFDGTLDYKVDILLTENETNKLKSQAGDFAKIIKEKRFTAPFKIGGTYSKPKISLDLDFNKLLKENLGDVLKGLFGK
ncbi:MAG: AsmA family protein [candidate division Zixibacteria bacterium]|nr:AsmA family protein [candidate division Zixibacteria bacterium]